MKVSIIIPAYNEARAIGHVLDDLAGVAQDSDCEVIVINDGSTDDTASIVKQHDVTLIEHSHNRGYGASLKTGIKNAKAEIICMLDADGQHRAEDLRRMLSEFESGRHDMLVGVRDSNSHFPLFRRPGKRLLVVIANYLAERKIPDLNCGLRIFKKDVMLKYMHILPNGFSFSTTSTLALIQEGFEVGYTPITVDKRAGKSTVSMLTGLDTILLILRLITLFRPLKVFLPASLIIGGGGFAYLLCDLFVSVNVSDTSILLVLVGVLLFFFGLMADQMAHIRRELKS